MTGSSDGLMESLARHLGESVILGAHGSLRSRGNREGVERHLGCVESAQGRPQ